MPLTVAPVIAPDRKVEFDLKPWGEAAGGVRARFRLPKEGGASRPMIDVQNSGSLDLKLDVGRPRVELDGKWYAREKERESLSFLPPGRNYQGMGPISLDTPWIAEETHQPLVKTAGRHAIRVKYMAQSVDGKTKPIEVVTAPLIVEFDARGFATTQPVR